MSTLVVADLPLVASTPIVLMIGMMIVVTIAAARQVRSKLFLASEIKQLTFCLFNRPPWRPNEVSLSTAQH